jgi:uncharacterized membrane protein
MNNHLRDLAKKRFNVTLEALPEREHRVVQHFGERLHISHDTNLEFDKKLTFGQRLADKVAAFGGLMDVHHHLCRNPAFLGSAQ